MIKLLRFFLLAVVGLVSLDAFAASYSLPADIGNGPFSSCSGSGPVYSCSDKVRLRDNDTVVLTSDVTLNINGDFQVDKNVNISNSGFVFNINATEDVDIGSNSSVSANITAGDDIQTENGVIITGNISAADDIELGEDNIVNGNATAGDNLDLDNNTVVNGVCSPTHSQCTGGGGGPPPSGANSTFILSTRNNETLGGLSFGDDDLIEYDGPTDTSTLVFDGGNIFSDGDEDIDAVHYLANGNIVISTTSGATIGGITIENGDMAEYNPVTDSATLFFDEDWFSGDANINAVYVRSDGLIILSTNNDEILGGLSFEDEDLVLYNPVTDTASLYLNGDNVFNEEEDIDAVHVLSTGNIVLSTLEGATIGGLTFEDGDLVEYDPVTGSAQLFFAEVGSFSDDADISALFIRETFIPLLAYYALDESVWNGTAGEITDDSGAANNGTAIGNATTVNPGRVCLGGNIPLNITDAEQDAIDTGLDLDADIGTTGTISFWYKPNTNWNGGGDRMLVDAGTTEDNKYFFVALLNSGILRFRIEDSNDGDYQLDTGAKSFVAGDWHHIAITWDLPGDRMEVYIDGTLDTAITPNTSGSWGALGSVYLGDNRSTYHPSGTPNSANGVIDEVYIYSGVRSTTQIQADMNATHTCAVTPLDHFSITPATTTASTCLPNAITIIAEDASNNPITSYINQVNITVSTNHGNWSVNNADNVTSPNPDNDDNGAVSYTFVGTDVGEIVLDLINTHAESPVTITVSDPVLAVSSTSVAISFSDNVFVITEDPVQVAGRPQAMNIAMWTNDGSNCFIDTTYNYGPHDLEASLDRGGVLPAASDPTIGVVTIPDSPATATISLDFSIAPGQANFNLDTTDVGQYSLTISDSSNTHGTSVITGSSSQLTVRPFGIAVNNIEIPGPAPNPGGTAPGDPIFTTAGSDFAADVAGVLWDAADDTNNDGVLDTGVYANNSVAPSYAWDTTLSVSAAGFTPATGAPGALNNATVLLAEFSSGSFNVVDLQYTEVGSFTLQPLATDFLGEPTADIVGDDIIVGRFIPASFQVTINTNGVLGDACGVYTYMGEDFSYSSAPAITVTALNALGATTTNYRDGFVKLTGSSVSVDASQDDTTAGSDTNPLLVSYTAAAMADTPNNDGTVSYSFGADAFRYGPDAPVSFSKFPNSQVAPFVADINPEISAVSDTEVTTNFPPMTHVLDPTGNNLRFGRLRMTNTHGSELNPLLMPAVTEFWTGTGFQVNVLDTCTAIASADLVSVASPPGLSVPAIINSPALAGDIGITFPAPGAGNDGFIDTTTDLSSAGDLWLRFDWDSDGDFDDDPSARATFGIFSGNPVNIYLQQIYQ